MIKVLFVFVFMFCLSATFAQSSDLTVQIENIEVLKGKIMVAVFDNEDNFKTKENPNFSDSLSADNSTIETFFNSIPQGIYAIAIYHDENYDGKLNAAKLGIPTEGVGFSGYITTILKKPKFEDCAFEINRDTTISISMIYKKKKD